MEQLPWEINPELTRERLVKVAGALVAVRERLVRVHAREAERVAWGIGCLAYELSCQALVDLSRRVSWLRVSRSGLACSFLVGGELFRFYRGDERAPGARRLRSCAAALAAARPQLELFPSEESGWFWLFALETDGGGKVTRVTLMQARDDGQTRNHWQVPVVGSSLPLPAADALHGAAAREVHAGF